MIRPDRPEYVTLLDENGNLQKKHTLYNPNDALLQKQNALLGRMEGDAFSDSPSSLAKNLLASENANYASQNNQLASQADGNLATSLSNMAMKGGLSAGARERMGTNNANSLMDAQQGLAGQHSSNMLNINTQDAQYKQGLQDNLMSNYQGMYRDQNTLKDKDIQRNMGEHQNKYGMALDAYNSEMSAWAAKEQADATRKSGKK